MGQGGWGSGAGALTADAVRGARSQDCGREPEPMSRRSIMSIRTFPRSEGFYSGWRRRRRRWRGGEAREQCAGLGGPRANELGWPGVGVEWGDGKLMSSGLIPLNETRRAGHASSQRSANGRPRPGESYRGRCSMDPERASERQSPRKRVAGSRGKCRAPRLGSRR